MVALGGARRLTDGETRILLDVPTEIAKNLAMKVPALKQWRLRQPRAGVRFTGEDRELLRYAFQSLGILQAVVGDVTDKTVVDFGPGDFLTVLAGEGLQVECHGVTTMSGDLQKAQPRFREMPPESVLTSSAIFVCRKDRGRGASPASG